MEREKRIYLKKPEVSFQIVSCQLTPTQVEAGKRLFRKLIARAQSSIEVANQSKEIDRKT